jgi:hypothetical protein
MAKGQAMAPGVVSAAGEPDFRETSGVLLLPTVCPNCGRRFEGTFCSGCGEKRVEPGDYSLWRFLGDAVQALTNVEAPFLRSLVTLVARPGRLTADYLAGRRRPYLRPLQLFLFCNLLFFFAQVYTGSNTFTTPLNVHLHHLPYSPFARQVVGEELRTRHRDYTSYQQRFDRTASDLAKSLVLVMAPMQGLFLQLLYWRSRRHYVEHLVFSLHFYSFFLLMVPALITFLGVVARAGARAGLDARTALTDNFVSLLMLVACAAYLLPALRRVYAQNRLLTAAKGLLLLAGLLVVLQIYRFFLFFATLYASR